MVKYLAFAACAAKAPITQKLTRKIDDIVQTAGSAENVQRWMFWTVPQATVFANSFSQPKVLLLGGNGVGKTVIMMQRAKELSIVGEEVVFCIGEDFGTTTKTLLHLQTEAEFEDFHTQNPQSKKIQVKSLNSYDPSKENLGKTHVFIEEITEDKLKKIATLQTKSCWVTVSIGTFSKEFKDANEAITYFKSLYPEWYIPFFNYILRTTQNVAKELKKPNRSVNQNNINNESRLNKVLDVPQNIQEGPEPVAFISLPSDQFYEKVKATFTEIGQNDMALVLIDITWSPVNSLSSKTIREFKTEFANYWQFEKELEDGHTLAFLLKSISASGREPPLFWIDDCSFNSNEDQIKDWIRGKSKCDLITNFTLMEGFEASTCISFSSATVYSALSRTRVKHVNFHGIGKFGKYENID